jgi:hypothetical protein
MKTRLTSANNTSLMSEVSSDRENELEFGISFKKAEQ